MRKFLWLALFALLIGGGGWWYWSLSSAGAVVAPATYKVARGSVAEQVLASGQIEASSLVSVGAQVSGRIETLAVTLGDRVEKDQLVAQIDSLDQQNAVARARAELKQLEAQIVARRASARVAELAYNRQKELRARGTATQEGLDTAEADLDVLRAELEQLEAQRDSAVLAVASAQVELDRTRITSPIAGTVVAIVTEQGQTVNANQSAPTIVKIADLDSMVVKAEISEADVVRVSPGLPVTFTILGEPNRTFEAEVNGIEPAPASIRTSDTISSTEAIYYKGLFAVANPDHRLRIGMTAEVTIALAEANDVLVLPSAALGRRGQDGKYTVTIYDPATGAEERRSITVGMNNNVTAEVTEGLAEGELILASGAAVGLGSAAVAPRNRGPMSGF